MTVVMVAFWAVVILAAVASWRTSGARGPAATAGSDPIAILAERLDRGEIDEREHQERRDLLGSLVR